MSKKTKKVAQVVEQVAAPVVEEQPIIEAQPVAEAPVAKVQVKIHPGHSTKPKPVALVWKIADELAVAAKAANQPHPRRKDIVEAAQKLGINYFTARTQYQSWYRFTNSGTNLIGEQTTAPAGLSRGIADLFFPQVVTA